MYRKKTIAIVIPAYNEAKLIKPTLENVPKIVDMVFVVDDCSPDNQNEVILEIAKKDKRIQLIKHITNQGPGGSIISGYLASSKAGIDITVVVGGDNQMDLSEVTNFLDPIIDGKADYAKGNRFLLNRLEDTLQKMPRLRLIGNILITALTKIASGYYKTMDVVDGYTAISRRAIDTINWDRAWKKYGYPMDFLIRLNAYGFKIIDIPRTAIYLAGERQSQIKGFSYFIKVSPMLLRGFFWRLRFKYIFIDFHPLVFFYYLSFLLLPIGMLISFTLILNHLFFSGSFVNATRAILASSLLIAGFQFLLFAMLFDMEEGK
ncbi:MAG: glycosyltransferase family 2 protein [Leptospira sp.]|nr:glycosyltransferase family 2 protein [Leptospira sp.]